MLLADLASTSAAIAATSSRLAKVESIAACLRRAAPPEVAVAVSYLSGELRQIHHREGLACAGCYQRRKSRGRERQHRLHLQTQALAHERAAQPRHPREQVQTPLHFQQQAIRRRQAHARREPLCADRKLLQLFRVDSRQM